MDEFVHYYDNQLKAKESTKALKMALQKGGFNLTKFISNTTEVLDFLNEPKTENKRPAHRVLGSKWDTMNDTLIIQPVPKSNLIAKEVSLRKILSNIARIFDPPGLIAPFVITLKILLQKRWRSGISCDQEVPQEYIPIIENMTRQYEQDNIVKIPRFIGQIDRHSDIQLHVFTDASQCAMAACIYIRILNQGHKQSSFMIGKTKVAPLNQESIPKLELQAALIGARLSNLQPMNLDYISTPFISSFLDG